MLKMKSRATVLLAVSNVHVALIVHSQPEEPYRGFEPWYKFPSSIVATSSFEDAEDRHWQKDQSLYS